MERTKEAMVAAMLKMNKESGLDTEEKKAAVNLFRNSQKVGNKVFLDIPLTSMRVDHDMYQRPLQRHVRTIAKNWNDDKCDPLMVNYRKNGFYYIIDGQHRFEAAKMRGMESLVCTVFVGLSIKEEADLFTEQNEGTKKLSPFDTYKANLCRGEEIDTQIQEVCNKHGIVVERGTGTKKLKSVTAARGIVRTNGKENLDWIFTMYDACGWNNYGDSYTSDIITSMNNVKVNHADELRAAENKLKEFFRISSPKEITALANVEYPQYGRVIRLNMIMDEIIKGSNQRKKVIKDKIAKIA